MTSPDEELLHHSKLQEEDLPHQRPGVPPAVRPRCKKEIAAPPAVPPRRKREIGVPPAVPPRRKRGHLLSFLSKLGLLELYPNKLTLSSLLEISDGTMLDKKVESLKDVPLAFIRKLLMINTKCRNHTTADSGGNEEEEEEEVNPLDLVTALYLCADSFLQQEMSIKMSMCQFAVPFLLPCPDNNQCTLMVWALRNIYKEWRPHDLMHNKNHLEDSVVHAPIPLLTFVRLKDCRLSKSQFINHILSTQQSIHFTHRDMDGGNVPKKIANGLVEIAWCLPCGQSNIDVFPEPVAIVNMRGDILSKETQFSFLMQVSTAVFVFFDTMTQEEERLLDLQGPLKSKLFLVMNSEMEGHHSKSVDTLKLQENHVLIRKRNLNMAKFSKQIIGAITTALEACKKINIEEMSHIAHDLGISVDECKNKASQSAKLAADNIMEGIGVRPIADYKKKQLPLQSEYFKKIAEIEMEECRLQNAGDLSLEEYKAQLLGEKCTLRKRQGSIRTAKAMEQFIQALSLPQTKSREHSFSSGCH
ncbi:up-regulator of cell proliferation-like [Alosa alosa]|uniref:up-regulator of cell proliferation-like n=1 Tax=Alosa alosa TaxID=278164 RepID=UPI00201552F4|nr:up-regulator of cell proliferation-like [Alosa alosa]